MLQRSLLSALLLAGTILSGCAATNEVAQLPPPPVPLLAASDPMTPVQKTLLEAHNKYRAEAGVPPMVWSSALTAIAQRWADHLAKFSHALEHSGMLDLGENVAMSASGKKSAAALVQLFASEKRQFSGGTFPDVSRTGDWHAVAHYTQMVWRNTTEVGCGAAKGGGNDYLVCEYAPEGNILAERVY